MPKWLRNLRIHRASFVDEGANQYADIILHKRSEPVNIEDMIEGMDGESREALQAYIAAQVAEANESAAVKITELMNRIAELEEMMKAYDDKDEDEGTGVDKAALPADVQKRIDDMAAEKAEIQKRLDAEINKRRAAEFVDVAKAELNELGDPNELGPVLLKMSDALGEQYSTALALLKTANAAKASAAEQTSTENGSGAEDDDTPDARWTALVKARMEADKCDRPTATVAVLKTREGRQLYTALKGA